MAVACGWDEESELRQRDVPAALAAFAVAAAAVTLALGALLLPPQPAPPPVRITAARPAATPVVPVPTTLPADTDLLLASPAPGASVADLTAALGRLGYETVPAAPLLDAVRVRVPAGTPPADLARRLAGTGLLSALEADVRVHADRLPGDPLLTVQRPYLDVIHAPAAWDLHVSAATVTIAVVDTGIDITHPDLAARIQRNPIETLDGRDDDGNGCPDDLFGCTFVSPAAADPSCGYTLAAPHGGAIDDDGHGTFVAGIAAASADNAAGIAGIAGDARLLPVKVLDCTATGRISDAAAGILYAARAGARVIILAFGSASDARVLRDAVAEATDHYGALVVASVGNEGAQRVQFPAAYPGVLAVAGSGVAGGDGVVNYLRPAVFTNSGPEVSLFAPALRIAATVPQALCGQHGWTCANGPYATASGTSFAAPLAAGTVALLLGRDHTLSPALAAALVRDGTQPLVGADGRLLDVLGALTRTVYAAGGPGTAYGAPGPPPDGPGADPLR